MFMLSSGVDRLGSMVMMRWLVCMLLFSVMLVCVVKLCVVFVVVCVCILFSGVRLMCLVRVCGRVVEVVLVLMRKLIVMLLIWLG